MLIYPAVDLKDGRCVRLLRGAFDSVTSYGEPAERLDSFVAAGARWVHIVDLDGARRGEPVQHELIGALKRDRNVNIQCGGGVRERAHVEALLNAGIERVVVGSAAVRRPEEVARWIENFGAERICLALDVRQTVAGWQVVADGWTKSSGCSLNEALSLYPTGGVRHVLVTDISRDGALTGSNIELMRQLVRARSDITFQASGGVAALDDVILLREAGAGGVIIGRALYERSFPLEAALAV